MLSDPMQTIVLPLPATKAFGRLMFDVDLVGSLLEVLEKQQLLCMGLWSECGSFLRRRVCERPGKKQYYGLTSHEDS